jgi:hypothetical protein
MINIHILIEHIVTNWPFLIEAMNPKEVQFLTQKFKDEADDFKITISDEDIKNAINTFDTKFKQDPNVTEKDLRKYSLTQLLKLISTKPGFEKEKAERKIETTPDVVYNEDGIVIYSGDVEDKCIKYGAGERWCITKGSYGNYRFDAQRGYPIFYLVKNTNLPDSDPLSFVAIQVRNNGEYVYTNRLNNPHESEEMSFDDLENDIPYLNSIENIKSILKYIPPNIKEKNKEQKFKEGISFNEWSNDLDFNDKKLYLSIRGPIATKEKIAGTYDRIPGQLFTNLSTDAFVTKVLPKYDKLTEWLFQNPWIFNFNILLNNIELFKPPYQKSLLIKVNSPGHPINVTGNDILNRKFDFNINKTLVSTNKIPNDKNNNFYLTENGNAIVNVRYDRNGIEVDVITEDETYKDIKLSKRTQKYLFDYPGIVNIPLDSLARAIQVNDLDSDKITDVINAARKSNDTSKKIIKVGNTEVLFDTSGNLLKTYQIENNSIKPVDNNNEDVIKATNQFIEDASSNEEIQNNLVTSILNRRPMFNDKISLKVLENTPKDKLIRGLEGIIPYNDTLYSFVLPERFEFKGFESIDGRMIDRQLNVNPEMGAAYGEFLKNNNIGLTNAMIINMFESNRWRTPYPSKVVFASVPNLPYAENSTYRLAVNDGKIYIVNTANPAESFRISEKTGRILSARAPRTATTRPTPAQLGAGERVAAPLDGPGRRGRPAGGTNRPIEGNISDDLTTTLTNSGLLNSFDQLPIGVRSRFFGDSTRGNLRNDRGVSRRDNLLGNLGHVDYVRIVGPSAIYGIQLESGNVVASIVAQPGNSHWLITQNGAFSLDSPANLVAALRQRNLTEIRDYIVNEYMERNPNQVNELKDTIKKHIKEIKNK